MIFVASEAQFKFQKDKQAIYFYASWMPFHKRMVNMINKMEQKYPNIEYFAIDIDFFKNFIKRFEISSIPTVVILDGKKEIKRIEGIPLTSAFNTFFVDICK